MAQPRGAQIRAALGRGHAVGAAGLGPAHPAKGAIGLGRAQPAAGLNQAPQPGASGIASQPTASPWNALAANKEAAAIKRREDTLAGLGSQWQLEQQSFGLEGPYANYENNPYSKAAQLQRSYDQGRQGTTNAAALKGHLYGGSLISQQLGNQFNFGQGYNALQSQYAADFARNTAERRAAEDAAQEAIDNARWEALQNQIAEKPEAETAPEAIGGGGGGAGVKGKSKARITKAFRRGKNI